MRLLMLMVLAAIASTANAADVARREVQFYSEGVLCAATLYTTTGQRANEPTGPTAAAVVLAPVPGETRASLAPYAEKLAQRGLVAMTIDYRGFGGSGGFLYFGEPVRWDDRLRFTQMTAKMHIRRGRLEPRAQVIDIRNAITYLQGEANVDRARIGVWGADLAGGHAIVVAGSDARVKAAVAQTPVIAGKDEPRAAFAPNAQAQATMIRLARSGSAPASVPAARTMNAEEAQLAAAEYRPYWYLEQIPATTAVAFVIAEKDTKVSNETNAIAASKVLRGATNVTTLPGANHVLTSAQAESAANAAAEWFAKSL